MIVSKKDIQTYTDLLAKFQSDILYFIASLRRPGHALSIEEILAEVNYRLIRYSNTAITKNGEALTEKGFSKLFCGTCKNVVRWTAKGASFSDKKYIRDKAPNRIVNESGDDFFDFMCLKKGEDHESFTESEKCDRVKNIKIWIEEYSDFLTDRELETFKGLSKGNGVEKIGKELGISHQAISCLYKTLEQKIKANIKSELSSSSDASLIKKARGSINRIFST